MDFNEARDDEVSVASAGQYANHLHLAADRYPLQHLITQFLQTGCSSWCLTIVVKALKPISVKELWVYVFILQPFNCIDVGSLLSILWYRWCWRSAALVVVIDRHHHPHHCHNRLRTYWRHVTPAINRHSTALAAATIVTVRVSVCKHQHNSVFTGHFNSPGRGHGKRLCKKIAKHVIWTRRMLWIVVDGRSW